MKHMHVLTALALAALALASASASMGCSEQEPQVVGTPIGGTCLACHQGISDVHPAFALACVDCHGGDDQIDVPAANVDVRDQDLLRASHVLPKVPEAWWANGIDDDDNGEVDEAGEFFDPLAIPEGRATTRFEFDGEMNRDVNYLRFINPGDLRVAEVSCGGRNKNANDAMVCHAEVVYDVRRSIMATNAGVPAGALYGNNQRPAAADYGAAFAQSDAGRRFDERNERIGRAAYAFDFDTIDEAYDRNENQHDVEGIRAAALADCDEDATVNCDQEGDKDFEALAGPLFDDGTSPLDPGPGRTRTGNDLAFFDANDTRDNRSIEVLQYIGNNTNRTFPAADEPMLAARLEAIAGGPVVVTNPVDAALRVFRAYHVLNFMSPANNFGNVVVDDPNDIRLRNNNNPFGRFQSSGCSACHIQYAKDGRNQEPIDRTVADNGRQPETDLPFGVRVDLGQRAWPRTHQLQTVVPQEQCAQCHGFVTRVDYALQGKYELETDFLNFEQVQTIGNFTFTTPAGSCVEVFDNLAEFENGVLENDGLGVTEDDNGNGELDDGEDLDGDACLDIPDRVARPDSFDGRQSKLIYGGANGSTHLVDVHTQAGMACVDCHVTSVHGDSNIYTRNWDAEPMECDDCHGTPLAAATLVSSGPNGGDDFTAPIWNTPFDQPWFERRDDGTIVEHSRTIAGLSWVVPQLVGEVAGAAETGAAHYAHNQPVESGVIAGDDDRILAHVADPRGRGGLECYTCHSSWQPNCLTCHLKMDVAKQKQEIWYGDQDFEDIFFQLFSYTRSPFYLGRNGDVEANRVSPYRSTMQVNLTVVAGATTVLDNASVASERDLSSMVSNPYFPHTVRTLETKSCARCHTLVDDAGRIANDHMITEASGQGTGRYMNVGDFAVVASSLGLEQIDLKAESGTFNPQAAEPTRQFPGFDFSDAAPRAAPVVALPAATDVALLRGVAPPQTGDFADVAIIAHAAGVAVVDVTGRDNAGLPPTVLGERGGDAVTSVDVVDTAAQQSRRFVALTATQLCTLDFAAAIAPDNVLPILAGGGAPAALDEIGCVDHGRLAATKVRLHGRFALVAHDSGVDVFELDDDGTIEPGAPGAAVATFATGAAVADVASSGRFVWAATLNGVEAFDAGAIFYGAADVTGAGDASLSLALEGQATSGLAVQGSRLLVAAGAGGLVVLDVALPADPRVERTFDVAGGFDITNATAVVVATVPTRNFALVADGGTIKAINLSPSEDMRTLLAAAAADPDGLRGFRLSLERQDPLTPYDAHLAETQLFTYPTQGAAVALARGYSFDNIADKSGRPLRDVWSLGAAPLDQEIVRRMRDVVVRELGTTDTRGDGMGCIVRDGDELVDAERCVAITP